MNVNNRKVIAHKKCRLCKYENLESVFSLGNQYINDFVEESKIGTGLKAPLEIVHCINCDLAQLRVTAPQELLYSRKYWYRSGVTDTMKNELKNIVNEIENKIELNDGDIVLDIGANDGTMLSYYEPKLLKVGCEPADNLISELKNNADISIHDFWSKEAYFNHILNLDKKKAKVVTAIGMFYDLDDPVAFVSDIEKVLDDEGIFVAQLMTLAPMLEKNDLGNICHEHIEYYSYKSLVYMYEKCGLEITEISENSVNGGSYRIYAKKIKNGSIPYQENAEKKDLIDFKNRIDNIKTQCINFLENEKKLGKITHAYGASTKGNVILQYFGLDTRLIDYASERSPEKYGRFTVGSWIPILSEEESRKLQPDYYFVLPWAFFDEMYNRENEWRKAGGKFIVPFPEFRVVE